MPKETVACTECGDKIERWPSHINAERNFCDRQCRAEWQKKNQTGENNPNYTAETVECDNCGSELERPQYRIENYNRQFCDLNCKGEYYQDNPTELHEKERFEVECTTCGKTLERIKARVERSENHFCGRECKGKWWSEQTSGEDHVLWNGGWEWYYGDDWREQRQKARKRDDYRCWFCGVTDGLSKQIHGKELDVHHVRPLRKFDDLERGNRIYNLLTVCSFCHQRLFSH